MLLLMTGHMFITMRKRGLYRIGKIGLHITSM